MKAKESQRSHELFGLFFLIGITMGSAAVVPLNNVGFGLPKLLIFAATATVGAVWLLWQDKLPMLEVVRRHRLGQFWGYFIAIILLSFSWAAMPIISALGAAPRFGGALTYVVCFTIAACAINLCQFPRSRAYIIGAIVLSNAVVVGYGFLQLVQLDPLSAWWNTDMFIGRVFSFAGQPNVLASFIVLTLPFVEFPALNARLSRAERTVCALLTLLNIAVLLGTASRAGILGLLVNVAVLGLATRATMRKRLRQSNQQQQLTLLFLGLAFIAGAITVFTHRWTVEAPLRSIESRVLVWGDALRMIADRPQGYGLDAVGVISPEFSSAGLHTVEPLTAVVDRAHALPLDLWLTLGPLGFLSYYAFLLALLAAAWRLRHTSGSATAGGLGLLSYSIMMLFGFETVLTQLFFWLIAGLIMGITWHLARGNKKTTPTRGIQAGAIILGALSLATVITSTLWLRSRSYMARAELLAGSGQQEFIFDAYAKAARAFVYDRETIASLTEHLLQTRETSSAPQSAALDNAIERSLEALDRLTNGYDATVPLLRGWHAATQQNAAAMREALSEARKRIPNSIDAHRVALHAFILVGDEPAASEALNRLISLLPEAWRNPQSLAGRILWKENPWLVEIQALEQALE